MGKKTKYWDSLSDGQMSADVLNQEREFSEPASVSHGLDPLWPDWHNATSTSHSVSFGSDPKVVFLFSDFDAPFAGVGKHLYRTEASFRAAIDTCARHLEKLLDQPLQRILWPEPGQPALLQKITYAQPALFSLQYALANLWSAQGILPDALAGYGVGEYAAACVAGTIDLADALELVTAHASLWDTLPPEGWRLKVFTDEETLLPLLGDSLHIAACNGCRQTVLTGRREDLETFAGKLHKESIAFAPLKASQPHLNTLMDDSLSSFEERLNEIELKEPRIPFISTMTGQEVSEDLVNPEYWTHHLVWPVRFDAAVDTLLCKGYDLFVEIGPSSDLTVLGKDLVPKSGSLWIPSLRHDVPDLEQMRRCLDMLFKAGVPVNLPAFELLGQ